MLVKASRITNLTDARYFAAKEVQYLGFILEEGAPGFLDPMYMKAIREWVAGPKITGEFVSAATDYVAEAAAFFQLDAVQIPAALHLQQLNKLANVAMILEIDGGLPFSEISAIFQEAAPHADCFLLNFNGVEAWGDLLYADRILWNELLRNKQVLLEADFKPEQLEKLFSDFSFSGISVAGGAEEKVGVKSFDQLEEIFDALEEG